MNEINNSIVDSIETFDSTKDNTLIATVGEVTDEGITLIFAGSDEASEKKYSCNSDVLFKAGDRVKISKESGSYIVEYPIGAPMDRYPIPTEGTTGYCLRKTDEGTEWSQVNEVPDSGTTGYYLQKTASGYDWAEVNEYSGPTINGNTTSTLGFYGTSAVLRQTLSITRADMGYTSATASNYLIILNNIAGILKKLGLLK